MSSLPKIPEPITKTFADWVLHMIEYGIFSVLLLRAFGKSESSILKSANTSLKTQAIILAILIATFYGITDPKVLDELVKKTVNYFREREEYVLNH